MEYTKSNNTITHPSQNGKIFFKDISKYLTAIIVIALFFTMAQSLIDENEALMTICVILTIVYCLFAKAESIFYILCGMTMFENVFKINGDIAWFIPLIILAVKLLLSGRGRVMLNTLCSLVVIFIFELILDAQNGSFGQLLVNLVTITFVFIVFSNINVLKLDAFSIVFTLLVAFSSVIYYLLTMYGGIGAFISSFMSSAYAYRFGHSYGETIGGAMAIPLYTTMLISCGLTCYLKTKKLTIFKKLLIFFGIALSIVFGAMTISRSFYLGLIVTLLFVLFFKSSGNRVAKSFVLICVIVVVVSLFLSNSDVIKKVFSNLQLRLDNGVDEGSGGRTDIWFSCINYLLDHPINLFFGMGATNYILVGEATNELFAAGSHNLFLDFLMSWGIIGSTILIVFLLKTLKRQKESCKTLQHQNFIPLITYVFFAMTALRSCSLKTWLFLLIAYAFVDNKIYYKKGKNI